MGIASLEGRNIVQVIENFAPEGETIGGAGTIMRSIALEAKRQDANIKVLVDSYSRMPKNKTSWNRDSLEVHKFPFLRSMPRSVYFMGKTFRRQILARLGFGRIIRLTRPDIAHLHLHPNGVLWMGLAFKQKTGARIIATTHGLDPRFHKGTYRDVPNFPHWIASVEAVDAWVPCGPVDHKGLREWGIPEEKIVPIYNGVEVPELLPEKAGAKEQNGVLKVGYAGRMIERKGIYDLAKAMVEVARSEKNRNFVLTMAGGCTQESHQKFAECFNGAPGNLTIEMPGEITTAQVKELLLSSDIFCYPSKSPWEGLPVSILEAAAWGCPMVLSDHYAHLAVYEAGRHAVFFRKSEVPELVAALLDLVRNRGKSMTLRENAYVLVKEKFSLREMLRNYMHLYGELVQSK